MVTRSGDEILDINALQTKFDLLLIIDEQSTPTHYRSNPIEFALLVTEKIAEITEGNGIINVVFPEMHSFVSTGDYGRILYARVCTIPTEQRAGVLCAELKAKAAKVRLSEARAILCNIAGDDYLSFPETNEIIKTIEDLADSQENILFNAFPNKQEGILEVTLLSVS